MKKLFIFFTATALSLAACNDDDANEADGKMDDKDSTTMTAEDKEERNKQTALASVQGVNSKDVNVMFKEVTPDAVDYGDGSMPPMKNLDSVKATMSQIFTAFPDWKGENLKAVADGDWVMVWGEWSGTWKGDIWGQKASGKSFKIKDVDIFKFNDEGRITEHHGVQSFGTMASQIGMKMPQ
jgi:predicted ester cyclase